MTDRPSPPGARADRAARAARLNRDPRPAPRRRADPPARRPPTSGGPSHRGPVRPRYGRIAALGVAAATTVVALLGAGGVIGGGGNAVAAAGQKASTLVDGDQTAPVDPSDSSGGLDSSGQSDSQSSDATSGLSDQLADPAPPAASGQGRRIVFDQSDQRVWLIGDDGDVDRTYLVSGSVTDNLKPGHYEVVSRQPTAIGVDNSGTMTHFVVFTYGTSGAGIGFHDIPVKNGEHVQTRGQLGTPLSHGCIRQKKPDALALWKFAPMGTKVVVTA